MPALHLEDIHLTRGRTPVFAGLNLVLPEPRIGLIGHNGAGKTSLLRLLCGLETPERGRFHIVPGHHPPPLRTRLARRHLPPPSRPTHLRYVQPPRHPPRPHPRLLRAGRHRHRPPPGNRTAPGIGLRPSA